VPSWVRNSYMPMTEDIAASTFARCEAEMLLGHGRAATRQRVAGPTPGYTNNSALT
jgi:hypothetical protein